MAVYRNSIVLMLYAIEPTSETPTPFAEFRVFNYSTYRKLPNFLDSLKRICVSMLFLFKSTALAYNQEAITMSIEGVENNAEVDYDEFVLDLKNKRVKGYDKIARYVAFFKRNGDIRKDYNEDELAEIEVEILAEIELEIKKKRELEDILEKLS